MIVSPFRLIRGSTLTTILARGNEALRDWQTGWCKLPAPALHCVPADQAGTTLPVRQEWHCHQLDNGVTLWWYATPELAEHLRYCLFALDGCDALLAGDTESTVAAGVVADAINALVTGIVSGISNRPVHAAPAMLPNSALLRPGSGAALVTLETGIGPVCWLLPHEVLTACEEPSPQPAPTTALVPLHSALSSVPLTLTVELADTELTLGYLQTLAVGDILPLPAKLDQPFRIVGPGGTSICAALLGTRNGFRAVELVKTR